MSGWVSDYLIYNLDFFGYLNIKRNSNVKLIKLIKIVTIYNALWCILHIQRQKVLL